MQLDRLPPHDIIAEQSVIGSILLDGNSITKISGFLLPQYFYREAHRHCYETCLELFSRNESIDQITVSQALKAKDLLESLGGQELLNDCVDITPTSVSIVSYARIVEKAAIQRNLISAGRKIIELGYEEYLETDSALSTAEDTLFNIRKDTSQRDFFHMRDQFQEILEKDDPIDDQLDHKTLPIPTGFTNLNEIFMGGFQRSDMIVLAARPSIGKSMLGINCAINAAKENMIVGIFSLEMGREQIAQRMIAAESRVNMEEIRKGVTSSANQTRVIDAVGLLSDLNIYTDDTPFQTVVEMRGKARRLQLERGLDFLIIDYMQLIDSGGGRRDGNRAQEVSEISRQIKGLARDLNIPVLAISQLSRAIEHRQSHRPLLSDLRESGSIEQDADVVMFIHREEKYITEEDWNKTHPEGQPYPRQLAEIIIAKHRNGRVDSVEMTVQEQFGLFREIMSKSNQLLKSNV
ncbi:MAG: replicative DNA helicase [Chloroflexi bacterium]|nr:replicative DNA helicase [Chloroflexota bacterium]|tara:strand:- start:2567 stop:3958 length:1392 start_codon:yes stop_codon:yes gene_type:complete